MTTDGAQALAGPPLAADTAGARATAEPWPTVPPTVTPPPAAAAAPMPTPIPLPRWEDKRTLGMGEVTLFSVQEAEAENRHFLPFQDRTVYLRLGYSVQMYVDLAQLKPSDVQRDGNAIVITIPRPRWERPTLTSIAPLDPRYRTSDLFEGGPPLQVIAKGVSDVVRQLEENPGLQKLAHDAARTQMREFLEDLGFRQVTVIIAQ